MAGDETGVDDPGGSEGSDGGSTGTTPDADTGDPPDVGPDPDFGEWTVPPVDILDQLPHGDEQRAILCARGNQDPVASLYCDGGSAPTLSSLEQIQQELGLAFVAPNSPSAHDGNPAFALTGHSPSLSVRLASPINPRAIVFTPPDPLGRPREGAPIPNEQFVAMAFTRGEQFVELAARDTSGDDTLRFYLLVFEQACNEQDTCTPADFFSPSIESGFSGYTIYEDEDLTNTVVDCNRCHQPNGPDTDKALLMQQLQPPWTHFMSGFGYTGPMLLDDYFAAHAIEEAYAGIPGSVLASSDAEALQLFVENNGFVEQPIEYPSLQIEAEVFESSPAQPFDNDPPGQSAAWDELLDAATGQPGNRPAYHDAQVADLDRLADFTAAYVDFDTGASTTLPDLAGVFLDAALPDIGVTPRTEATGQEIVEELCGTCHHDEVDPSLSRSKFNAFAVESLDAEARGVAIDRVLTTPLDPRSMPPIRSYALTQDERQRVIEYLSSF